MSRDSEASLKLTLAGTALQTMRGCHLGKLIELGWAEVVVVVPEDARIPGNRGIVMAIEISMD